MVFIGDALNTIGKASEASAIYQKIIKRTETDQEFAARAKPAMSRIRSQLIGLLRHEGKHEQALKQVDQLIKDNPTALEPLMEKGRILDAWSEKDPGKFSDAVSHWTLIRTRLQSMKKKPPEYYEVMYNVAASLVHEAEKSKDKAIVLDRAKKAEQVLKAALILNPKLDGPDMVARYKVLVNKAIALQGRSPEKTDEKKP
jgi:tetratricopeptide (TPR) repeat protein